jgi:hypothetical protein
MLKRTLISLTLAVISLGLLSCNQRTDKDEGGVILTISSFDGLPFRASVNGQDVVQVEELVLQNLPKDPNGLTSSLMDIELRSFEATYTRADVGTRLPPARVAGIFGNVPVNGNDTINNLDILGLDQLRNPPLSDLLFENGSFDRETGAQVIQLNVHLRFFGRTLSGDSISSNTASFLIEFVP